MEATHGLESQGQALSAGSKSSSPWKPLTSWRAKDRHCQQGQNPAHHGSHSLPGEPRTGIVSRVKIQLTMEATHLLESQGQALSAGSKSSSPWKPLTTWRAKDRHCQQGQNPARHGSHSQTGEPRTGIFSRVKIQLTMEATHKLESQGQALSAGSKSSSPWKPLTDWRAKDRHCQQGQNPAHHGSHSPTGEPRTGIVSRVKIQLTMEATHFLESQGQALSAGSKSSSPWKPLTDWRAKDRHCQQGQNPAHHGSHSPTGEPRTGIVSRVKIQLTMEATHQLESQGQALSAESKSSSPWKPLTSWRAKDRHCQQGQNPAHHGSHSQTGEPRTGIVSRVKIQLTMEATHQLESQGQALSAGSKSSSPWKPLTFWRAKDRHCQQGQNPAHHGSHSPTGEPRTGIVSRVKIQLTMEATHFLESQGQALSAGSKSSSPWKPLTYWRAKDRHCQQGQNPAHHGSHSQTGEPRTGIVSRVKIQLTMEATHRLESQGQALSAGSKSSSPWKPLTSWRAKDRHCQQGPNPAHHGSHSPTGEPRTGIVSRDQIQLTTEATHSLESQGQALSAGTKSSSPQKPVTSWRAKDRHCQQGPDPAHHGSHSLPGEPRTGIVSRDQIQLTTEATHKLESQGQALSAGTKSSSPQKPLTF